MILIIDKILNCSKIELNKLKTGEKKVYENKKTKIYYAGYSNCNITNSVQQFGFC